jgi:hypothetical protein
MRKFLCLLLLLAVPVAMAQPKPLPPQDTDKWLKYYYMKPQPNLTVPAILAFSQGGVLKRDGALEPFIGFFSVIFRQNAASIPGWMVQLESLPEPEKRMLRFALWYSGTEQGKAYLRQAWQSAAADARQEIDKWLADPAQDISAMKITTPGILDMLWASFSATGELKYVTRIIEVLPWINEVNEKDRKIGELARWSLISNAIQHQRVMAICEQQLKVQPGAIAEILKDVLAEAKQQRAGSRPK